jgi:uncharacterized protein
MAARKGTSNRGFASMDEEKQRAIASKGGQRVPDEKRSFSRGIGRGSQGRPGARSPRSRRGREIKIFPGQRALLIQD